MNQCSTSSPQVKVKSCNVKQYLSLEETDPEWFKESDNEEFYYIVKNKEYSGDSKLAETKNMYISEILLANKIAEDFMSCSDQNSSIKYIYSSISALSLGGPPRALAGLGVHAAPAPGGPVV